MARTGLIKEQRCYKSNHATNPDFMEKFRARRKSGPYQKYVEQYEGTKQKKGQAHLPPLNEAADPKANYRVGRVVVPGEKFAEGIKPHNAKLEPSE
jgi:hypothetical protein